MTIRNALAIFLGAALALLVAACASLSVRHLERVPWIITQEDQTVSTRVWSFTFHTQGQNGFYLVAGEARPIPEAIPAWARWIKELSLEAYLCDSRGDVLAVSQMHVPQKEFSRDQAVPFEFLLNPGHVHESTQIHVAFGYTMKLVKSPDHIAAADTFLASETALSR